MKRTTALRVNVVITGILIVCFLLCRIAAKGCNKTIRTTRMVRSPQVTAANRHKSLHCVYRFLKYSDNDQVFELNFKSFHVGQVDNSSTCSQGYVQIVDDAVRNGSSGFYCGKIRRSRIYIAETNAISVVFHVDKYTRHFYFRAQSSVLPKRLAEERHKELAIGQKGVRVPGTYCDRLYVDCEGDCDILSPGFPGFYPRNSTCRYHVIFNRTDSRVVIGGSYYDTFDVWGGPSQGHCGLFNHCSPHVTTNCPYDYLQIYEGQAEGGASIGRFCGKGPIPRIVSRGNDVILEFVSAAAGSMINDGFYLSISSESQSPPNVSGRRVNPMTSKLDCHWVFRSNETQQGYIHSLRHWYSPNTRCSYQFLGQDGERVWLHFNSFSSPLDNCDEELSIYDAVGPDAKRLRGSFCKHLRPNETMVSSSSNLYVEFSSTSGSLDGSQFQYAAIYMFVNTTSSGKDVANTVCDEIFSSDNVTRGSFDFLQNRLRLHRRQVQCKFLFVGQATELVRITFSVLRFDPRKSCNLKVPSEVLCSSLESERQDHVIIHNAHSAATCICESSLLPIEFVSRSSFLDVRIKLYNVHYMAYRESDIYIFRGHYEFLQRGCGHGQLKGFSGTLVYPSIDQRLGEEIQCRWTITVNPSRFVLLKFQSLEFGGNCTTNKLKLSLVSSPSQPYEEICINNMKYEVFPPNFKNDDWTIKATHQTIVELFSNSNVTRFKLQWTEVAPAYFIHKKSNTITKNVGCEYLCADKETCLSRELICNGVIDCPEQNFTGHPLDEHKDQCSQFRVQLLWIFLMLGACICSVIATLMAVLLYQATRRICHCTVKRVGGK